VRGHDRNDYAARRRTTSALEALSQIAGPIPQAGDAGVRRAVGAAEKVIARLDAVPDHATAAVLAYGRKGVDCALEAIEHMVDAIRGADKHWFVVVVPADLAGRHRFSLRRVVRASGFPRAGRANRAAK